MFPSTFRRIPGVVNTDAHYNFHGSGWISVPEASPAFFYGLVLGGLGLVMWRRRFA